MTRQSIALLTLLSFGGASVVAPAEAGPPRHRRIKLGSGALGGGGAAPVTNLGIEVAVFGQCFPAQSNCIVSTATPLINTYRPAHAARTWGWNNTTRVQAFEANFTTGSVESPLSTYMHAITFAEGTRTGTSSRWLIMDNAAVAATAIEDMASGDAPYTSAVTEFGQMIDEFIAAHPGVQWRIGPNILNQHEQNEFLGTTEADYITNANGVLDVLADLRVSLNALESTSFTWPAIGVQIWNSSHASVGANATLFRSNIARFQYRAARDNTDEIMGYVPVYWIAAQSNQHFSSAGADLLGAHLSKYMNSWLDNPDNPSAWLRPLRPQAGSFVANANSLTFNVTGGTGTSNLATDTASVTAKWMSGFSVNCPSQVDGASIDAEMNPVVTAVAINSPAARQITLTFNRNLTSDCTIEYGTRYVPRSQPGPTGVGTMGGNIRNTNTARLYGHPRQDWDWLQLFEEGIDTCTNCTASVVSSYGRANSLRTDNSPVGGVSLGNWTTPNNTQHASFCEVIENASWPASNTAVVWAHEASSRTQMSLRGGSGGGQLRWLLSSTTNDTGTSYNSANSSFSSNTPYLVCGAFDGTQATNDGKVNMWRCTTACSCTELTAAGGTFSGTIPANLTTVVTDLNISGQSEGGNSLGGEWQHEHMMWWGDYTITNTEVNNLCTAMFSTVPPTLGGIFATEPEIYLPLQGNLENKGRASNVAIGYGTGLVWQGAPL